jgi:hypothetical protein
MHRDQFVIKTSALNVLLIPIVILLHPGVRMAGVKSVLMITIVIIRNFRFVKWGVTVRTIVLEMKN